MIIRKAKMNDFKHFLQIDYGAWHNNYAGILDYFDGTESPKKPVEWDKKAYKAGKLSIFVAENSNEVLGYVVLFRHNSRIWLYDILVKKEHQNKGIGTALMNYVCKNKKIFCTVNDGNRRAIEFFKKFGFKPVLKDVLFIKQN